MTIDKIKTAYSARPFKPFTVHLADGRVLPVSHPEFMAMLPGGRNIFIALEDGSYHIVDLLLVVSLGFDLKGGPPRRRRRSA
jgi:hypothetical protein